MAVTFPTCSAILFFEFISDSHGRTCYCGIQRDVAVSQFPYKLDRWDLHVFIDGDSGQYDITHEVTDSGGDVIGRGVWGRFSHSTPNTSTHLLGQPEYTTPAIPRAGIYTIAAILRKDGESKEVGRFRIELAEADRSESAPDLGDKGVAPQHLTQSEFDAKQ
jgi:hypothetical protein